MNHRTSDIAGDAHPASEPQAVNDARPKVQPLALAPDYTHMAPSEEPQQFSWVVVGKDQVLIHPTATHDLMLEMSDHGHFSRPHAKGTLHLFDNWDAEFELLSSTMNLDIVQKALKKAAKTHGWEFKGLLDEGGYPHLEKTGAARVSMGLNGGLPQLDYEWIEINGHHTLYASHQGDTVGWISLDPKPGGYEIRRVSVDPRWQRMGVATELLRQAREELGNVEHSESLSDDGRAWSEKVGMSLNPEAFAKYPQEIAAWELGRYTDHHWQGGPWANRMSPLRLERVPLDKILGATLYGSDTPNYEYQMSGKDWEGEYDGERDGYYTALERAIREGGDVEPLVLVKQPDGMYESDDGWHRASIARHLGLTEFPAYVYDPSDGGAAWSQVVGATDEDVDYLRNAKVAADFGVGPNNPGVKDWRNKEWAGTDQFDQMPPPGWDDAPDESEPQGGAYECSECGQHFPDYGAWREHTVAEHTRADPLPSEADPYVNMDATFPNNFVDYQRKQDQLGVVAGWVETSSPHWWVDNTEPDSMMQYAEQVPIEALLPSLEYDRRPDAPKIEMHGEQAAQGADRDYWDALKRHIDQHGILTPLYLQYDPDSGHAYMGEGNHRVRAAQELGHTHVPVIVYRSRRGVGHGGAHIPLKPLGGQLNEYGYEMHVPQYIRPSDVGLPVREVNPKEASHA